MYGDLVYQGSVWVSGLRLLWDASGCVFGKCMFILFKRDTLATAGDLRNIGSPLK